MILWRIRNKIGCKSETKKGDDYASAGGGVFCVFVFLWKKRPGTSDGAAQDDVWGVRAAGLSYGLLGI